MKDDQHERIPPALPARAGSGDREARRELVEASYPLVRRWAFVRVGDDAEADDLTQDVMIRMLDRVHTWNQASLFESWLFAMVRNAATDRGRRRGRHRRFTEEVTLHVSVTPQPAPDPLRDVERAEQREALRTFFEELPTRQREVFDLVELQGLSAREAAEIMGVEAVSVRAHLFKARRTMRARLLEERPAIAEEYR